MIDRIQGPPRWDGPDVLLRQTSFRALSEPRRFREPDGSVSTGELRVRFGEVEARGIALTPEGRDMFDAAVAEVDRRMADNAGASRQEVAAEVWAERFPRTEIELWRRGLAYFTYRVSDHRPPGQPPTSLSELVDGGWIELQPIVYEDFLPRSAAGIFASNLTGQGSVDDQQGGAERTMEWMSDRIGRPIHRPEDLYAAESEQSRREVFAALSLTI